MAEPREPYKGLRPYEEADQDLFFGRDDERNVLIDKVLANRLTLLFAATGVGKSSLLQAAVLPRLKDARQENLDVVLEKLSKARILRSQKRGDVLWYELYHDLFSESVENWREEEQDTLTTKATRETLQWLLSMRQQRWSLRLF